MAIDASVLDALLDAGATAEMIVAAVKADMAKDEVKRQERRGNNAERQRRYKARHRNDEAPDDAGNALPSVSNAPPPLPLPPKDNNSNPPAPTPVNNIPARKGRKSKPAPPAKPLGVRDETWKDFLDHREAKRAPLTPSALAGMEREAAKAGWQIEDALAETMLRGWQAFKADWVAEAKPNGSQRNGESVSYFDHYRAKQSGKGS